MKDYYYILGVKPDALLEEIKRAYRKLSIKFHPDKNDGDEFFTERFKEIQEAWDILGNNEKRLEYDSKRFGKSSTKEPVIPQIISFKANKSTYDLNEEITFTWVTANADKATLNPFGNVELNGEKTYRIKIISSNTIDVQLIAENSTSPTKVTSSLTLSRQIAQYSNFENTNKTKYDTEREEVTTPSNFAQTWQRLIAYILDIIFYFVITVFVCFMYIILFDFIKFDFIKPYISWIKDEYVFIFAAFLVTCGYWIGGVVDNNATLGKKVMRIKVTDENGTSLDIWRATFRFLIQNFGIILFGFGILMEWDKTLTTVFLIAYILIILSQFLNPQRRAIYDIISNSYVTKICQ